jgi:glutathione S-transferase
LALAESGRRLRRFVPDYREGFMTGLVGLVTLLAVLFYVWTGIAVSQARTKHGIKAPAMTGNADFERAVRVQANTLEWLPIFIVCLWMFPTTWLGPWLPAALGLVWIVGRVMYMQGYTSAADKRGLGFLIQGIAVLLLFLGSLIGVIQSLLTIGIT